MIPKDQQGRPQGLSEEDARGIFGQVLAGMQHMHGSGVCNRDIKEPNIMLTRQQDGAPPDACPAAPRPRRLTRPWPPPRAGTTRVQLTDLGLSHLYKVGGSGAHEFPLLGGIGTIVGTREHMAPEINAGLQYDGRKADVWSLGIVLFGMLTGFTPWNQAPPSPTLPSRSPTRRYSHTRPPSRTPRRRRSPTR